MSNKLGVTWYNETGKEFTITTEEELYDVARLSDFYTFEGQIIRLGNDIVMNQGDAKKWLNQAPAKRWIPISNFAGTFDGQGHTISGLYGKAAFSKLAMFINTKPSSKIRNIKLTNSVFVNHGGSGTGSFVASGSGTLEHLYSDAMIQCNGELCGGIASKVDKDTRITHCWFNGVIRQTGRRMGGILAEISGGNIEIRSCMFSGNINSDDSIGSQNDGVYAGGIVGRIEGDSQIRITDTYGLGHVTAPNNQKYLASFIGRVFDGAIVNVKRVFDRNADSMQSIIGRGTIEGTITRM